MIAHVATQVIVDHGNSAWDNWKLILFGIALAVITAVIVWAANDAADVFWTAVADRAAIKARETAALETLAASLSTAADAAAMEARVAAGDEHVTDYRTATTAPTRLSDHRRRYGRKSA